MGVGVSCDPLCAAATAAAQASIPFRRALHQRPELGWCEIETTLRIADELEHLGLSPITGEDLHDPSLRLGLPPGPALEAARRRAIEAGFAAERVDRVSGGFTGVVCDIVGANPGPLRVVRADLDALAIQESGSAELEAGRLGYRSELEGSMHACGHDAHAAIGVGLARVLAAERERLSGTVRLVFQPAEEGVRGAASMVARGWADQASELYAFHVGVRAVERGSLVCGWGPTLATTKWRAVFVGREAHAAIEPERGVDALLAACQAVVALKALPAQLPPGTRVHVGRIAAGTARNVVAGRAVLELEARALDATGHARAVERVVATLAGCAEGLGAQLELDAVGSAPAASSSPELVARVAAVAQRMSAWTAVDERILPFGASDDAATWLERVQARGGQAVFLGLGSPTGGGHHHPAFELDEAVFEPTIELLARLLLDSPSVRPSGGS